MASKLQYQDVGLIDLPKEHWGKTALIIPAARDTGPKFISYEDLDHGVSSCQEDLARLGVKRGSRIAVVLPNGLEFILTFLACVRLRAIMAPLNPQCKLDEYNEMFTMLRPSLVVLSAPSSALLSSAKDAAELAAHALGISIARWMPSKGGAAMGLLPAKSGPVSHCGPSSPLPAEIDPGDKVLRLYTSGTTGLPKAVELSHENLLTAVRIIIDAHHLTSADRCIVVTPLFHVAGIGASLVPTLLTGGTAILPPSLPGRFWDMCREYRVTWYHAVPTLHRVLLALPRPDKMPELRFVRCGGSELDADLFRQLESATEAPLLEIYGMTETSPGIFCNRITDPDRRPGVFPLPATVETRILTQGAAGPGLTAEPGSKGEVCVRGRNVMAAYVGNQAANADAFIDGGFFRTGDMGTLLPRGYLQLTGRIKEIINKGGEKISPTRVEAAARAHEGVLEAACFRVKDAKYGEDVGLAVVRRSGRQTEELSLKKFLRGKLALFQVPKIIVFVDSIPTNRTGKPKRSYLSEQFGFFAANDLKC